MNTSSETPSASKQPLLRLRSVSKRFGTVQVLSSVNMDIFGGEVHILAGENGAGKSTLIKILGGVYSDYEGVVELDGKPIRPTSPLAANALGVAVIFQELSLVGSMSVTDNLFLGQPITRGGFVRASEQRRRAREMLAKLGLNIDVDQQVEQLPIGSQQMVEIAKAVSRNARVLVMDEPTSALSRPEVAKLFDLIAQLKQRGCGIVYITHKMEEVEQIGERITVLRDGKSVGSAPAKDLPVPTLVQWMVGRELEEQFPRHMPDPAAPERLRIEGLSVYSDAASTKPVVHNISFSARRGEIIGIGGLQGSGASQLLLGLFGAYGARDVRGRVLLDTQPLKIQSPRASIDNGVALLTSDRKTSGLVLPMSITANTTLAVLNRLDAPGGWRREGRERAMARELGQSLRLRAASMQLEVGALSGGNQQKVVLAKWLATEPKLLLLDEPTRGIDVAAKREIYQLMNQWTARGITILLITSELPELLAMSDRIIVLHCGEMTAQFTRENATPDSILRAAMGSLWLGDDLTEPVGPKESAR
jgi:ABC-type sugar transport system ATPase subunit